MNSWCFPPSEKYFLLCKYFMVLQIHLVYGRTTVFFFAKKSMDVTMKKGFLLAGYTYLQKIYTINLALQKLEKIWATRKLFLTIRKLPNVTELHNQSTDEVGTPLWRPSHQAPCSEKSQSWLLGAVSIVLSPGMDTPQPPWATSPGFCPL